MSKIVKLLAPCKTDFIASKACQREVKKMKLSTVFMRTQIAMIKSISNGLSLDGLRKWQDRIGDVIASKRRKSVTTDTIDDDGLEIVRVVPKDETSDNVILYLHGGGYACGGARYARGFASVLGARFGTKVYAPVYRLAPENPFPCAPEDAYKAFSYLVSMGIPADRIILCGESAGGGLCYSLCLMLKEKGEKMPGGIISISPWTDLTLSADSYTRNAKRDPSMTKARLEEYANEYVADPEARKNPLASPIFGDLADMPPSIIIVGEDEVMIDDSLEMHKRLTASGSRSKLIIEPKMWHAYVLYNTKEAENAFEAIEGFLRVVAPHEKKLRWMGLDNSAKIYPAARRRNWSNVFRLSITLDEDIDKDTLRLALDIVARRFPSIAVRLKTGVFWYYIEEIPRAPEIMDERSYPLSRMAFDDIRKCAFRVIVYKNRLAVEFFHAVTDGNGGMVFLKTLACEYLKIKHGIGIDAEDGILDTLEEPKPCELEDSFMKIDSPVHAKRAGSPAYKLDGTREPDGFRTNTTFIFDADELYNKAKSHGVTVTAYMSALLAKCCIKIQEREVKNPKRRKHVKILIPVNLRGIYNSQTLRNFVFYVCPGVDPKLGEYTLDELCKSFASQMTLMINEKQLSSRISTNVRSEKTLILKLAPLFLKNFVMKMIFNAVGERTSCFSFSNIGVVKLPDAMAKHTKRMDVLLGVQSFSPYNTALITYGGKSYLNIIRNIKEPTLERVLYEELKAEGIRPCVENNARGE